MTEIAIGIYITGAFVAAPVAYMGMELDGKQTFGVIVFWPLLLPLVAWQGFRSVLKEME